MDADDSDKLQVFRCDKISLLKVNQTLNPVDPMILKELSTDKFKDKDAVDFEVSITDKGIDMFLKENYPSMKLISDGEIPVIKGYYNKGEANFISHYFASYGEQIISIKPVEMKTLVIQKLEKNLEYIKKI